MLVIFKSCTLFVMWYSVELILHSRGRVVNDSTLRIRIDNRSVIFSLFTSVSHSVQHRRGQVGKPASSAGLPVSLLLCCHLCFVVKPLLLFSWVEAQNILLSFTPLEIFEGNTSDKSPCRTQTSDQDLPRYWTPLRRHVRLSKKQGREFHQNS